MKRTHEPSEHGEMFPDRLKKTWLKPESSYNSINFMNNLDTRMNSQLEKRSKSYAKLMNQIEQSNSIMKSPSYGKISSQTLNSAQDLQALKGKELRNGLGKVAHVLNNSSNETKQIMTMQVSAP